MVNELPEDFDWVTAKSNCNAGNMLQKLKVQAQGNMDRRNALRREGEAGFEFDDHGQKGFTVYERSSRPLVDAVDFTRTQESIVIQQRGGGDPKFTVTLAVGNNGVCRCKVGDELLEPWQVLMKALEPLFFPS